MKTRTELAALANEAAAGAGPANYAPRLTAESDRLTVLRWCLYVDPNGLYTDENQDCDCLPRVQTCTCSPEDFADGCGHPGKRVCCADCQLSLDDAWDCVNDLVVEA